MWGLQCRDDSHCRPWIPWGVVLVVPISTLCRWYHSGWPIVISSSSITHTYIYLLLTTAHTSGILSHKPINKASIKMEIWISLVNARLTSPTLSLARELQKHLICLSESDSDYSEETADFKFEHVFSNILYAAIGQMWCHGLLGPGGWFGSQVNRKHFVSAEKNCLARLQVAVFAALNRSLPRFSYGNYV